jgi:hypothetical protein
MNDRAQPTDQVRWFSSDLLNATVRYGLVLFGAVSAVLSMAGDYTAGDSLLRAWLRDHVNIVNAVLHLVLITLILFLARIRPLPDDQRNPDVSSTARCINKGFLMSWQWMWSFFGLLYLVMLFKYLEPHREARIVFSTSVFQHRLLEQVLQDLMDLGSTGAILLSAMLLSPAHFRGTRDEQERRGRNRRNWRIGGCFLIYVAGLLALRIYCPGSLLYSVPVSLIHHLLLGLGSAMAMGFLAARLDSPFIAQWHWAVLLLYVYAGLQVVSTMDEHDDLMSQPAFLYAVFSLKSVWFIFVSDLFANKRILYYAYESTRPFNEKTI